MLNVPYLLVIEYQQDQINITGWKMFIYEKMNNGLRSLGV